MFPFSRAGFALGASLLVLTFSALAEEMNQPPAGFVALFNGRDLTGWRGGSTFDPRKLAALPDEARAAQLAKWTGTMRQHWSVANGELINDGQGDFATTEKEYGNFELLVDYKTVPRADSGVYLRGCPQVQIWDSTEEDKFKLGADKGSGGLWNNSPGAPGKDPLLKADGPFGEWNHFRILIVGSRVSVWLNGQQTVNHAIMENFYDKSHQTAIPARGPMELQTHGGEIRWRNIFLREIGPEESNRILQEKSDQAGFEPVFNGRDWEGWAGPVENYEIVDGAIRCLPKKGGTPYTKEEYGDFIVRLEINIPSAGNSGLALRYPGQGDAAYDGMCELQVLDEHYDQVKGPVDPRQVHGSAYGLVGAQRGYQYPNGVWNYEEVTVKGSTLRVELNGTVILDCDLSKVDLATVMHNRPHPGLTRTTGHFGFAGHNDPVAFRNIRIKRL